MCTAMILTGCSKNKTDEPVNPDEPNVPSQGQGEMQQMTVSESKEFISDVANEFLKKFRTPDQQALIALAAHFDKEYSELEAPAEFEIDPEESTQVNPAKTAARLLKAVGEGNTTRAVSTVITYTYNLNFDRFKGVYTPGATRWIRTGDSNDIVFSFKNAQGNACELKVTGSAEYSEVNHTDKGEEYNVWNGSEYDTESEDYVYNIRVPRTITLTLNEAGNVLVTANLVSGIDIAGHSLSINAAVTAMNITMNAAINGTDQKFTEASSLAVSGTTILSTSATINGSHLCDKDYIVDLGNKDEVTEDDLMKLFQNGNATIDVLGKVQVDGALTFNREVYKAMDADFDSYEYETMVQAESAAKKAAEDLNKYISGKLRFNNTVTTQAELYWEYKFYQDWSWYYELEPLMRFPSDSSTLSFEDYFEKGFGSVVDTYDSLIDDYKNVWNTFHK